MEDLNKVTDMATNYSKPATCTLMPEGSWITSEGARFLHIDLMAGDHSQLTSRYISTNQFVDKAVRNKIKEIIKLMKPGPRPMHLEIIIFKPITDKKANQLNTVLFKVNAGIGTSAGGLTSLGVGAMTGNPALAARSGTLVSALVIKNRTDSSRTWRTDDVVIYITAEVSGGLGQQKHWEPLVLSRDKYEPNSFKP